MNLSVAIIAGGKSSRMGTDKAFVKLADKPLIQHVIERTADLGQSETLLITNRPDDYAQLGLLMFTDIHPDKGSLGGIYTALSYAQNPYTLVVACDMPFVNTDLFRFMLTQVDESVDIVVPRVDNYPQGLHAIYGKACLKPIEKQLEANRLKIIRFYDHVRVRYLDEIDYAAYDPEGLSFSNLNTPEELDEAQINTNKFN
jgi:molybdenum cofactor guanylyltransferase